MYRLQGRPPPACNGAWKFTGNLITRDIRSRSTDDSLPFCVLATISGHGAMKAKFTHILAPLLGIVLFAAALWALHHQLRAYQLHDVLRHLHDLPRRALFVGFLLTAVSYLVMTGYDTLALRYIRRPLSYAKTALASFIGYAFSNNIGFSMVAGASVRYRLYTAWGLTAFEITQVVAFCSLTLWLGFFLVGGAVFLFEPLVFPAAHHFPFTSVPLLGGTLLAVAVGFILWSLFARRPIHFRGWAFSLPSPGLLLGQIGIASLDWLLAGSVLYALMPPLRGLSYPGFIGIFMTAQLAGLLSQVPGGLGVFETAILLLLSLELPASEAMGSLIAYRAIYYLLPLLTAAILLGAQEIVHYREAIGRTFQMFGRWISLSIPQVLAFATFAAGAVLLFSGALPAAAGRLIWLRNVIPLPLIEVSHFMGSLMGGGLLLVARGLQRRLDAAYVLTAAALAGGIVFSLLKGLDYEEAILLAVMLGALLPCRRHFYRAASLFRESFNPGWIAAIAAVILCALWLGFFSYKHTEYSGELWWRFTLAGNASRFLRSMVGVVAFLFFFALSRLLRPGFPASAGGPGDDLERAGTIVRGSPRAYANLAFLGDKSFLFSPGGGAFIMYGVEGRAWVAMGDPVGPKPEWPELAWEFRETADRYGGWTVFYEVAAEHLPLYVELGLTFFKLGEEARVPLQEFSLEGGARRGLRYTVRQMEKEGCRFQIVSAKDVSSVLPDLKTISDAWLRGKNTGEKGFSVGFFDENYLRRFPAAVVRMGGRIVAFTNVWAGDLKEELSVDLMRYLPEAPSGVMEYLFIHLMLWGRQEGYRSFNLGMAPLSGLGDHSLAPLWNRVGAYIFRHGEHFYNFQGLRQYKEKFDPVWAPRYLACPGGFSLPRILTGIAALVSGSLRKAVAK
jgi:phosphatidylglycerol lysyltransferase